MDYKQFICRIIVIISVLFTFILAIFASFLYSMQSRTKNEAVNVIHDSASSGQSKTVYDVMLTCSEFKISTDEYSEYNSETNTIDLNFQLDEIGDYLNNRDDKNEQGIASNKTDIANLMPIVLSKEEQNIAETLVYLLHDMMDCEYQEHPVMYLFEDAVVRVNYVEGYIWRWGDIPYTKLEEISPNGITCFLHVPETVAGYPIYLIYCIGQDSNGSYNHDYYEFYTEYRSLEDFFSSRENYQPLNEYLREFTMYVQAR